MSDKMRVFMGCLFLVSLLVFLGLLIAQDKPKYKNFEQQCTQGE
jgi:hypothetical protein